VAHLNKTDLFDKLEVCEECLIIKMETEKVIPEVLERLQHTGGDAVNNMEENKEGNAEKFNRGKMVDWCGLGVQIMTENLDDHEKVKGLSAVWD